MEQCQHAFKQLRTYSRALGLAHGILNCMGRCTLTGMLCASGQQFRDWTAAYRLFKSDRMDIAKIFSVIRKEVCSLPCCEHTIYAHMDDTQIRKTGKKVAGTSWQRDPLGPPFHTNFMWGQRFIQLSLSIMDKAGKCQSRAIPVDFHHCPVAKKPKKDSTPESWQQYKEVQKKTRLSWVGATRVNQLREALNQEGHKDKVVVLSVDGSYTNETMIKKLPENVTLIGRIRKDCRLHKLPQQQPTAAGRTRVYGDQLPTPEQIRQSEDFEWQEVEAWAAGKLHSFQVKVVKVVRWRKAGKKDLQLVVIRPLGYRLTQKSRMLYRDPAYLICTDASMEIGKLLQAYLWRWEIEVNFREEKTLLGCGKAQVRNKEMVEKVPAFVTAVYAILLLAANNCSKELCQQQLPRPKWYIKKITQRITTGDLINNFRALIWADNAKINFSDFVKMLAVQRSRKNLQNPTLAGLLYRRN